MFEADPCAVRPPLYDKAFEHDACGIGAVVNIKGNKSRQTVENALSIVEKLEHRAGKDAEGKTGDGVGILVLDHIIVANDRTYSMIQHGDIDYRAKGR